MFEIIRSKRRVVGILCNHIITTNLLVLLLKTKSIITAFLLVIGIVSEAMAVAVKRWTPLLFSCQSCCWRTLLLLHNNGWWSLQNWRVRSAVCRPILWSHHYESECRKPAAADAGSSGSEGQRERWMEQSEWNPPRHLHRRSLCTIKQNIITCKWSVRLTEVPPAATIVQRTRI